MGAAGNVVLLGTSEATYHSKKFIEDIVFSYLFDTIDLLKVLSEEEFEFIKPHYENEDFINRNPAKFQSIFLKIKNYLKENNKTLFKEHKPDIESIINLCDQAIAEGKKIDFTWSN